MNRSADPALLSLEAALARLAAAFPAPATEAVRADRDDPALDLSAMDGAAVRSADGDRPRAVLGTLYAGEAPGRFQLGPDTCVRIMTGAALPAGADAVVPVEALRAEGDRLAPLVPPRAGEWVRPRAGQAKAGEVLLAAGSPWNAARVGLRAQVGAPWPPLARVVVGIAATGDELAADPAPHQIRDANGPMLAALAHNLGAEVRRLPALPDDSAALRRRLEELDGLDILVTSGGVSAGDRDHLPRVLADMGAQVLFHKIRLKPGKPMLAALLGPKVVLGLPGNPASSYMNLLLFLPVAMAGVQGAVAPDPWKAGRLETAAANADSRPLLLPCRRRDDLLQPLPSRGSADLVRLAQADACAWVEPGGAPAGPVRYLELR